MTVAGLSDSRLEAVVDEAPGGLGWQDRAERRAVKAEGRTEIRSRRLEQRAAFLNITRDVLDIGVRYDAAPLVAIEDDEIELVELDVEQLPDREGDERELADRRAVLLLGGTQDGEMDEIYRRAGFPDVSPRALPPLPL